MPNVDFMHAYIHAGYNRNFDTPKLSSDEGDPVYLDAKIVQLSKRPDTEPVMPEDFFYSSVDMHPFLALFGYVDETTGMMSSDVDYVMHMGTITSDQIREAPEGFWDNIPVNMRGLINVGITYADCPSSRDNPAALSPDLPYKDQIMPDLLHDHILFWMHTHYLSRIREEDASRGRSRRIDLATFLRGALRVLNYYGAPYNVFFKDTVDKFGLGRSIDQTDLARRCGGILISPEGVQVFITLRKLMECAQKHVDKNVCAPLLRNEYNRRQWQELSEAVWDNSMLASVRKLYGHTAVQLMFNTAKTSDWIVQKEENLTRWMTYSNMMAELLREAKTHGYASRWVITGYIC